MTDQYLTVEEALRGWLNGETLQSREKGPLTNHGWYDLNPVDAVSAIRIDTNRADYRFKPKPPKTHTVELTQQEVEMLWQLTRMVGGCEVKSPRAYTASAGRKLGDLIDSERQAKIHCWGCEYATGAISFGSRMPE
jgi:hypothetical protein